MNGYTKSVDGKRSAVPVGPVGGDAAQLIQRLAREIPNGVGIALWSGRSIIPAPFRVPCQSVAVVGKRVDGSTLRA